MNFKITNKKQNPFYSFLVNNLSNYRNRGTATLKIDAVIFSILVCILEVSRSLLWSRL